MTTKNLREMPQKIYDNPTQNLRRIYEKKSTRNLRENLRKNLRDFLRENLRGLQQ